MFPEGGQTRKHCFLAMFREGETWLQISNISEFKQANVFVSVCGINLQHVWQYVKFLKFFAFLHDRYDAKCRQN
jgi:hypothetical protein